MFVGGFGWSLYGMESYSELRLNWNSACDVVSVQRYVTPSLTESKCTSTGCEMIQSVNHSTIKTSNLQTFQRVDIEKHIIPKIGRVMYKIILILRIQHFSKIKFRFSIALHVNCMMCITLCSGQANESIFYLIEYGDIPMLFWFRP